MTSRKEVIKRISSVMNDVLLWLTGVFIIYGIHNLFFNELILGFQGKLLKVIIFISIARASLFIISINFKTLIQEMTKIKMKNLLRIEVLYFLIISLFLISAFSKQIGINDYLNSILKLAYLLLILVISIHVFRIIKGLLIKNG